MFFNKLPAETKALKVSIDLSNSVAWVLIAGKSLIKVLELISFFNDCFCLLFKWVSKSISLFILAFSAFNLASPLRALWAEVKAFNTVSTFCLSLSVPVLATKSFAVCKALLKFFLIDSSELI
ncbi:hypothetical protein MADP12_00714 [Mycoplasma anatis]|nr:hypothetical protein [Mycoplasmopsis anatis]